MTEVEVTPIPVPTPRTRLWHLLHNVHAQAAFRWIDEIAKAVDPAVVVLMAARSSVPGGWSGNSRVPPHYHHGCDTFPNLQLLEDYLNSQDTIHSTWKSRTAKPYPSG